MKNSIIIENKKKSWRMRIVIYGFLIFLIYYFFIPKSNVDNANQEVLIPMAIQDKRFEYLTFSDVKSRLENGAYIISGKVKNNSYVYDLKIKNFTITYFSNEETTDVIDNEYYDVTQLISSGEEYDFEFNVTKYLPEKWWWKIKVDQVELVSKSKSQ